MLAGDRQPLLMARWRLTANRLTAEITEAAVTKQ
jgi:hypothetical protein